MGRGILYGLILVLLLALPACKFMKSEPGDTQAALPIEPNTQFAELPRMPMSMQVVSSATPPRELKVPPLRPTEPTELLPSSSPWPDVKLPPAPIGPILPSPSRSDPPLVAAVREYLRDRPDLAIEQLKSLDKPNQELLLQLIPAVVRASQISLEQGSPHEVGLLLRELQGPLQSLRMRGPLFIDKAVFCKSVKGFGRYDALPERPLLKPGSIAGLYVEVGNVPSEPSDAEGYVTHLTCTLEVRDSTGKMVDLADPNSRKPAEAIRETQREVTKSPVRDYFVVSWFPVPSKAGNYTISFEVSDVATGRAVSKTIPFRVQ